jgi:hypothetical protein
MINFALARASSTVPSKVSIASSAAHPLAVVAVAVLSAARMLLRAFWWSLARRGSPVLRGCDPAAFESEISGLLLLVGSGILSFVMCKDFGAA